MAIGPGRGFILHKFWRVIALAVAIWLTVALPCSAVEADIAATVYADTMVVTAGLSAGPTDPATASLVTRINLEEISGFGDLSDVLGSVAGLQMARLGGWGATAVPSLRGSAPAQIRFFVDGIPLPDAQTGLAGFGRLPMDRLQAIEVHRGVVPAGLGGMGGAGAINFVTRDQDQGVDGSLQLGSFGERGARITVGGASADNSRAGMFMLHGHRADNDFEFLDHNQTFHRTDDDTVRVRENAWVQEHGAWGSGRWTAGQLMARGSLGTTRRDGGRPGSLGYLSPNASVRYDRVDGQLHLDWSAGLLKADASFGRGNEFLYDPKGEVSFVPPGTTHAVSDDVFGRLAWSPTLVEGVVSLDAGLDWRGQWQTETVVGLTDPERSRRSTSAFASLTADLADGRLRVVPAWRWQHLSDNFPAVRWSPSLPEETGVENQREDISPSLGVVWTVVPDGVYVEAHAARMVRVPTWVELFGHRGGIDGNRGLLPERITSADVALSLRGNEIVSGRIAAFYAATDDKIIFVRNSQSTSKADNFGRTVARGVELELALRLNEKVDLSGNLTAQKVEDRGDGPFYHGNSLPFLPEVEAHARMGGRLGHWRPWLQVAYMSANYRDRSNTELNKAPARTLLNLGLGRDWYPGWLGDAGVLSVLAEVINLADNAVYDVEGFPLPGRSWHFAFRVRR